MIVHIDQNLNYYPDNKPYHFRIKLHQNLKPHRKWKVALTEISLHENVRVPPSVKQTEAFYIYSNICGESVINGINAPLLRRVVVDTGENTIFNSYYYIPIIKTEVNEIEFIIKDKNGALADHLKNHITIVIHFKV